MRFVYRHLYAKTAFYRLTMIRDATAVITNYKIPPKEYRINQYLLSNYKKDLRMLALELVKNCKVYHDADKTAIIIFRNKQDDDLATLITYGTDFISGSNILKKAFSRKE